MAKKLMKALAKGSYNCSIIAVYGTFTDMGVAQKVVFKDSSEIPAVSNVLSVDEYVTLGAPAIEFYTLKIKVEDRILTVNKFANKVVWKDSNGDGWTQLDFFTSGLQRQLGMEDVTDDVEILTACDSVNLYISPYTNPKTGAFSYNFDSTAPRNAQVADDFDIEVNA